MNITLGASTVSLEISSRNARVQARQNRWDCLRAGLDLILDQRGADNGRSACRRQRVAGGHYKGKEAERLVTRIDPGVVLLVAELRGHEQQAAEELGQWKTHYQEDPRLAGVDHAGDATDRRGRHRQSPLGMIARARLNSSREERRTDDRQ